MSIDIGFGNGAAHVARLAVPEHEQIWIWDQFYAVVLHELADRPQGAWLRRVMEDWAGRVIGRLFEDPQALAAEVGGGIVPDLEVQEGSLEGAEAVHVLDLHPHESGWPELALHLPEGRPDETARAVVALAQYFVRVNPLFVKDLALHVFAMRKYYLDQAPPSEERSVDEAPHFALQKAMKFFEDMGGGRRGPLQ